MNSKTFDYDDSLEIELPDFITNLRKSVNESSHQKGHQLLDKSAFQRNQNCNTQQSSQQLSSNQNSDNSEKHKLNIWKPQHTLTKKRERDYSNQAAQEIQNTNVNGSINTIDNRNDQQQQAYQPDDLLKDDKAQRNRKYAKKYREKKGKQYKQLEEENRFLKKKIDDLSFRLNEVQIQLNKIKNTSNQKNISNFKNLKENCIEKIQQIFQKKNLVSNTEAEQLDNHISHLKGFSEQKVKLLNYHMYQLLDNLMLNSTFYFTDSLAKQRGIWVKDPQKLTKMDRQICEILQLPQDKFQQHRKGTKKLIPPLLIKEMIKFHDMWKNLYKTYIQVLNQGLITQTIRKGSQNSWKSVTEAQKLMKLSLYFEDIKYRKDMRVLRQSWYQDCLSTAIRNQNVQNHLYEGLPHRKVKQQVIQ